MSNPPELTMSLIQAAPSMYETLEWVKDVIEGQQTLMDLDPVVMEVVQTIGHVLETAKGAR